MTFTELQLKPVLLRALESLGYKTPTPIQSQAIPMILEGRDLLGCAQTGTGKTAAFSLPTLHRLMESGRRREARSTRCLILTPTRELAIQIGQNLEEYGAQTGLRHAVIFGGVNQNPQINAMKTGVDLLVATPGRLLDLMNQGFINLSTVEIFTLDEADRMLDMGFVKDVQRIIRKLPQKRQTLFFSATMAPEILRLAKEILHQPAQVSVTPVASTAETIRQHVLYMDKKDKMSAVIYLVDAYEMESCLVFTRTKHEADKVAKYLVKSGIEALAIHGNKSQNSRQNSLNLFAQRKIQVLVATDIAARGIDIDELAWVINFDIPADQESYVHRIGRTGRAGAKGSAFSLCTDEERGNLRDIQKLIKRDIPVLEGHPFDFGKVKALTPMKAQADHFQTAPQVTKKRPPVPRDRGPESNKPRANSRRQDERRRRPAPRA